MKTLKKSERGNVLFLILIAVALFAALSYAVTQSSRSGKGDASSETAAVNAAAITQYPTGIRTALLRMTISGLPLNTIEFNEPADFAACTQPPGGDVGGACVFHPDGGGASWQQAPSGAMADGALGPWYYNNNFIVDGVGLDTNEEYVAFLPNITENLCIEINRRYNIPNAPAIPVIADVDAGAVEQTIGGGGGYVPTVTAIPFTGTWPGDLDGQPYGCFEDTTAGEYIYYHTIVEE